MIGGALSGLSGLAPSSAALRELDLAENRLDDAALAALCGGGGGATRVFARLERLNLSGNRLATLPPGGALAAACPRSACSACGAGHIAEPAALEPLALLGALVALALEHNPVAALDGTRAFAILLCEGLQVFDGEPVGAGERGAARALHRAAAARWRHGRRRLPSRRLRRRRRGDDGASDGASATAAAAAGASDEGASDGDDDGGASDDISCDDDGASEYRAIDDGGCDDDVAYHATSEDVVPPGFTPARSEAEPELEAEYEKSAPAPPAPRHVVPVVAAPAAAPSPDAAAGAPSVAAPVETCRLRDKIAGSAHEPAVAAPTISSPAVAAPATAAPATRRPPPPRPPPPRRRRSRQQRARSVLADPCRSMRETLGAPRRARQRRVPTLPTARGQARGVARARDPRARGARARGHARRGGSGRDAARARRPVAATRRDAEEGWSALAAHARAPT